MEDSNRIDVKIVELTPDKSEDITVGKSKKNKSRTEKLIGFGIIPDRPHMIKKSAEVFAEMYLQKIREDNKKKSELSRHTPNMIEAKKFFQFLQKQ